MSACFGSCDKGFCFLFLEVAKFQGFFFFFLGSTVGLDNFTMSNVQLLVEVFVTVTVVLSTYVDEDDVLL